MQLVCTVQPNRSPVHSTGSIWKRRSKGAERMVLSIPYEIESAVAKREPQKTNPEPSVSGSGFERSCDRMSEK